MSENFAAVLFLICVLASSCGQVFLKIGAKKQYKGIRQYFNFYVVVGYVIFFAMTLCSTYLYRYISIVIGTIWDSFGYVFVSILSIICFKEKWSKKKTIGILFIIIGTIFVLVI